VLRVRALSPFPRLIYGVLFLAPSPFLFLHSKVPFILSSLSIMLFLYPTLVVALLT
jgi:hypothetical protein